MRLKSILAWENIQQIRNDHAQFQKHVSKILACRLAYSSLPHALKTLDIIRDLPDVTLLRLISSPALISILSQPPSITDVNSIIDVVNGELARTDIINLSSGKYWSSLGDCYTEIQEDGTCTRNFSPKMNCGIPIDDRSPQAKSQLIASNIRKFSFGDYCSDYEGVLDQIKINLDRAFSVIMSSSPVASEFITSFTQTIILRRDEKNPFFYTSYSSDLSIGRVVLLNPHLETMTLEVLINSLIHEAIHQWLYVVESIEGRFVKNSDYARIPVESPWTRTQLTLKAFVHAWFVWFGCWCFWGLEESLNSAAACSLMETAHRGFLDASPAILPSELLQELRPDIVEEMQQLRACVIKTS